MPPSAADRRALDAGKASLDRIMTTMVVIAFVNICLGFLGAVTGGAAFRALHFAGGYCAGWGFYYGLMALLIRSHPTRTLQMGLTLLALEGAMIVWSNQDVGQPVPWLGLLVRAAFIVPVVRGFSLARAVREEQEWVEKPQHVADIPRRPAARPSATRPPAGR
jgi:hypothetical protein